MKKINLIVVLCSLMMLLSMGVVSANSVTFSVNGTDVHITDFGFECGYILDYFQMNIWTDSMATLYDTYNVSTLEDIPIFLDTFPVGSYADIELIDLGGTCPSSVWISGFEVEGETVITPIGTDFILYDVLIEDETPGWYNTWLYAQHSEDIMIDAPDGKWLGFTSGPEAGKCFGYNSMPIMAEWNEVETRYEYTFNKGDSEEYMATLPLYVEVGDSFNIYYNEADCLASIPQPLVLNNEPYNFVAGFINVNFNNITGNIFDGEILSGDDWIFVDPSSVANVPASITFENVPNNLYVPTRNGEICSSDYCSNIVNDGFNLNFDVTGFSNYSMVEAVHGCMDVEADNYDATAEVDDGSCEYAVIARRGGGGVVEDESREGEIVSDEVVDEDESYSGFVGDYLNLSKVQKFVLFAGIVVVAYALLNTNKSSGKSFKRKRIMRGKFWK